MSRKNKRCDKHGKWFSEVCADCLIDEEKKRQKMEDRCIGCEWGQQAGGGKMTCLRVAGCVKSETSQTGMKGCKK